MENSKTEDRPAQAQAGKRQEGAMRGKLGRGLEPDGDPEVDEAAARNHFDADLMSMLPRLRIYAMSLTHNRDRADDLVQQTVLKSLAGRRLFRPGTNFPGWLFRIERNEFISGLRRQRPTVELDGMIGNTLSEEPQQESATVLREFVRAFRVLPGTQRKALLLAAIGGDCYKIIAARSGVSEGTVKSRVSRGRATLRRLLADDGGAVSLGGSRAPQVFAPPFRQRAGADAEHTRP
jgi:RNA polymerase sigma-70 factor (ECF subfamily)